MKLFVRAAARQDLQSIAEYIARDNPARAQSFAQELADKIRSVAERPLSFPARSDWGPDLRSATHGRYRIIFRVELETVSVLRILHSARDFPEEI